MVGSCLSGGYLQGLQVRECTERIWLKLSEIIVLKVSVKKNNNKKILLQTIKDTPSLSFDYSIIKVRENTYK